MIATRFSSNAMAEIEVCLRQAAEEYGWCIAGVYDFPCKLHEAGAGPAGKIRVFELCNTAAFARLLERDPAMAAVLPWRIAVHEVEHGVQLATLALASFGRNPEDPALKPWLQQMETAVSKIMNAAARPRQRRAGAAHPDQFDHEGAVEGQMSVGGQIAQRIDRKGTKVEDLAGVGQHDAPGG